ncbi:methyltransferase domain-containing protein [Rhodobacterales bacterium LSUCC0387]|nr:methyltransferase domain-containing protein [Rhodobacterales bacterium LSUCC0387]
MTEKKIDYVAVVYNEKDRPLTNYPDKLSRYLFERFDLKKGVKLLDVGCGRGEFLSGFMKCGAVGFGIDQSRAAENYCPDATLKISDIENDGMPYDDNFFDVVYSKSVIEHFYYPERMVKEIFRVLKPGGIVITMCPDWEFNYRIYFEDYTHRTPFMRVSLRDIFLIHGFESVTVDRFRQLPVLWGKGATLLPLAELTRVLAPNCLKPYSKWVRFSKEIMLISSAVKPGK